MTELTKTLDFDLQITSDNKHALDDATQKSRTAYNKTLDHHFNSDKDYKEIRSTVVDEVNLIKNTTQLIVNKTYDAINNYYDFDEHNRPKQKQDYYPLRSNHGEGYNLKLGDNGQIGFRISAIPYKEIVRGALNGSEEHLNLVKHALTDQDWRVGTSEVVYENNTWRLHVTVTNTNAEVRSPTESKTLVGIDVNESNIALVALTEEEGVADSTVIEYEEVKRKRHEYFTIRKRLQNRDKPSQVKRLDNVEERFAMDSIHKLTRKIVEWVDQFENPCIVLEDLKDMRDSINYGSQMNRRLHSLPFGKIHNYITYKANFEGIPVIKVNPEYTSQECLVCEYRSRSNRRGGRFKCVECGFQDHADRKAGVSIADRGVEEIGLDWIVPPLNRLPVVRTEGCDGLVSGCVEHPTTIRAIA